MELNKIVLHQVIKEKLGKPSLKLSKSLLPINPTTEEFVQRIIKSYSSKNPTYGIFEADLTLYPFQTYINNYVTGGDFLDFTVKSMKILEKEISGPTTTGGYVVFIHYTEKGFDFLTSVMLDNSNQFSVDDIDLTIKKLLGLDIDRLARANRVNINKWKAGGEQYLSFIKGTRNISRYFQRFIGSTDLTSSKQNTDKLKVALQSYMADKGYNDDQKRSIYSKVRNYSLKKVGDDQDLELRAISVLVNEIEPDDFIEYISERDDLEVSGVFRVTQKAHLKFLNRIIVREKGYLLEFNRDLIKSNKIIKEGNDIIIKDIPADILKNF
ncbi:nucleoid-associated protein YejK [Cellulophaga sp. RHA19]|uniref:nucleoid-associated protein n=1 Tax=Cellulophaga sp. RHA19 TaxID=1798237 RepID=UPI000C2BFD19|nr:nucleoid-associated protein [Cellulophaga sp. RHA19]PKB42696.1 nucleoid-associated protein YejK [Cellulophaga sp. RHA19]